MLARLTQLTRHLSLPLPKYAHTSAAISRATFGSGIMTSSADERSKRMIHTAGCIIIGDEVLGGKVGSQIQDFPCRRLEAHLQRLF